MSLHDISDENNTNYNSVRNILNSYYGDGRTNKKIYKERQNQIAAEEGN